MFVNASLHTFLIPCGTHRLATAGADLRASPPRPGCARGAGTGDLLDDGGGDRGRLDEAEAAAAVGEPVAVGDGVAATAAVCVEAVAVALRQGRFLRGHVRGGLVVDLLAGGLENIKLELHLCTKYASSSATLLTVYPLPSSMLSEPKPYPFGPKSFR